MTRDELKLLLSKKRKDELQKLALDLGIDYPKSANKRELNELILNSGTDVVMRAIGMPQTGRSRLYQRFRRNIDTIGVVLTVIGLFLSYWFFMIERADLAPKPLDVDIKWYELKDGRPQLLTDGSIRVVIDDQGFKARKLKLPVNIAVRNRTGEVLEVASVQISYPSWSNVESQGKGQIDPAGDSIVYRHQIGTLPSVDEFTPLETIDILTLTFPIEVFPILIKNEKGMPFHEWALFGGPEFEREGKELKLKFRVDCKGHKPVISELNLNMPFVFDLAGSKRQKPQVQAIENEEAESVIRLIDQAKEEVTSWTGVFAKDNSVIRFSRNRFAESILQIVRVDDVVRRTIVDSDGDGFVDSDYLDIDGNGIPDQKIKYKGKEEMVDWHPDSLNSSGKPRPKQ
ncbi:hypothetical protein FGO68_gene14627 [Halteria grandinella]|uniref:Uncharacterized protein n=1 Tax=Halteria grandinella TaxID=5974 RepID=A0A8J8SYA8_HALGN|nr:hypothetical protein FGO68_gene14627 [Halteria grandinella]